MAGRNPNLGLWRSKQVVWVPPRSVPGKPQSLVSRHETHHHESLRAGLQITFGTRQDLEPGDGTHDEMQERSILKLHRIYYRKLRGGTKDGKKEGFR